MFLVVHIIWKSSKKMLTCIVWQFYPHSSPPQCKTAYIVVFPPGVRLLYSWLSPKVGFLPLCLCKKIFWIYKLNVIKIPNIFNSVNLSYVFPFACFCNSVRVISVLENKWKFLRQITFPAFVIGIMSHNLHNIHTVMYIVPCLSHKVRRWHPY